MTLLNDVLADVRRREQNQRERLRCWADHLEAPITAAHPVEVAAQAAPS